MPRRRLALTLFLVATAAPAAAQERAIARFNRLADAMEVGPGVPAFAAPRYAPARVAALWQAMDSVVLGQLARGQAVEGVDSVLATLRGFQPPDAGDGQTVDGTTFYGRLPRALPGYFVFALDSAGTRVMGVYSLGFNAPGRIAAYARRGGRWTRVGAMDADNPVRPYVLRRRDGALGVVTVETFVGGDRQDCRLKLWTLDAAGLRRDSTFAGRMVDCEARGEPGAVRISFDGFPAALGTAVLGVRLGWLRTLTLAPGGAWRVADEPANPWVHLPERYFGLLVSRRPAQARALLADPALAAALGAGIPGAEAESGDLAAGTGSLTIRRMVAGRDVRQRITSGRGADGTWRIVGVTPAEAPAPGG